MSLSNLRLLDAFRAASAHGACPLCLIGSECERASIRSYLTDSVMDPEARSRLSTGSFCSRHLGRLLEERDKLGLALILQTTLANLVADALRQAERRPLAEVVAGHLRLQRACPVCSAVRDAVERGIDTCAELYVPGSEFAAVFEASGGFCLPHFAEFARRLAQSGAAERSGLLRRAAELQLAGLSSILDDLAWFIKKHDYRFAEEPWKGAQDVVMRAVKKIRGPEEG